MTSCTSKLNSLYPCMIKLPARWSASSMRSRGTCSCTGTAYSRFISIVYFIGALFSSCKKMFMLIDKLSQQRLHDIGLIRREDCQGQLWNEPIVQLTVLNIDPRLELNPSILTFT